MAGAERWGPAGAEPPGVQGRGAGGGAEEEDEDEEEELPAIRERGRPARLRAQLPRAGGDPSGSAGCGAGRRGAEGAAAELSGTEGGAERPGGSGGKAGRPRGYAALLSELGRLRAERERLRERLRELRESGEARGGRRGAAEPCATALRELHRRLDAALRSQRRALRAVAELDGGGAGGCGTGRETEAEERRRGGEEGPAGRLRAEEAARERCGPCRDKERQVQRLRALSERLEAELRWERKESAELRLRLQLQLQNHRRVVAVYRTHLLSAAQGALDEAAHRLLLHIAALSGHRHEGTCGT